MARHNNGMQPTAFSICGERSPRFARAGNGGGIRSGRSSAIHCVRTVEKSSMRASCRSGPHFLQAPGHWTRRWPSRSHNDHTVHREGPVLQRFRSWISASPEDSADGGCLGIRPAHFKGNTAASVSEPGTFRERGWAGGHRLSGCCRRFLRQVPGSTLRFGILRPARNVGGTQQLPRRTSAEGERRARRKDSGEGTESMRRRVFSGRCPCSMRNAGSKVLSRGRHNKPLQPMGGARHRGRVRIEPYARG